MLTSNPTEQATAGIFNITVTVLTKNETQIQRTLTSVTAIRNVTEILVWDTGSDEQHLKILHTAIQEISKSAKVKVNLITEPMIRFCTEEEDGINTINFAESRNRLQELAENDFILVVDADEELLAEAVNGQLGTTQAPLFLPNSETLYSVQVFPTYERLGEANRPDTPKEAQSAGQLRSKELTTAIEQVRLYNRKFWKWRSPIHNELVRKDGVYRQKDFSSVIQIQSIKILASYAKKETRTGRVTSSSNKLIKELLKEFTNKSGLANGVRARGLKGKVTYADVLALVETVDIGIAYLKYLGYVSSEHCSIDIAEAEKTDTVIKVLARLEEIEPQDAFRAAVRQVLEAKTFAERALVSLKNQQEHDTEIADTEIADTKTADTEIKLLEEQIAALDILYQIAIVKPYSVMLNWYLHGILQLTKGKLTWGADESADESADKSKAARQLPQVTQEERAEVTKVLWKKITELKRAATEASALCDKYPDFDYILAIANLLTSNEKMSTRGLYRFAIPSAMPEELAETIKQAFSLLVFPVAATFFPEETKRELEARAPAKQKTTQQNFLRNVNNLLSKTKKRNTRKRSK